MSLSLFLSISLSLSLLDYVSISKTTPGTPNNRRQLIPLVIVGVIAVIVAVVGYQIYLSVAKIRNNAEQRMARHNMVFTKDGMRVGVKHIEQENYVDRTQSWVVKAWNMGGGNNTDPGIANPTVQRKKITKKHQPEGGSSSGGKGGK